MHACVIEISKSALQTNIRFLRHQFGRQVKLMSVVKANAYGHDIATFVPLAETCGLHRFAVFSAEEAMEVCRCRTQPSEIMIMGTIDRDQLEWAIEHDVSFYVFGLQRLKEACDAAQAQGKPAHVHLELETGLNRMGLNRRSALCNSLTPVK